MSNSITNDLSINDPDFVEKFQEAMLSPGYVILRDLAFPINFPVNGNLTAYIRKLFVDRVTIGEKDGKCCWFERNDSKTQELFSYLDSLSLSLLSHLGESYMEEIKDSKHTNLQFTHYPNLDVHPKNDDLLSEHLDRGFLTLLFSDSEKGLWLKNDQDEWIRPKLGPNRMAVYAGVSLESRSDGLYKPTMHKIVNDCDEQSRYACQFTLFSASGFNVPHFGM